jgi:large subunit ribosomal protein L20
MVRVKTQVASRRRKKRILKKAKGFVGGRHRLYKTAKETVRKGLMYAFRDRKVKKRNFRSLWILRINTAVRAHGLNYSQFIKGLKEQKIELNRNVLACLALEDPTAFSKLVEMVNKNKDKG